MCLIRNVLLLVFAYIFRIKLYFIILVTKVYSISVEVRNKNFETLVAILLFSTKMVPCHMNT